MHEGSEEFEFRSDSTTDCGVSCPLASEKNLNRLIIGKTVLPLFLGSFFYLQVTMTYIRAWVSSKFGLIRPRTTELPALERLKIDVATFSRLTGDVDMHESSEEFEIRPPSEKKSP